MKQLWFKFVLALIAILYFTMWLGSLTVSAGMVWAD